MIGGDVRTFGGGIWIQLLLLPTLLVVCINCVASTPESGSNLKIAVSEQFSYDDNLFRLPNGFSDLMDLVGAGGRRQDHINALSGLVNGQWVFGRQAIAFDFSVNSNRYSQNDFLNNTSGNGKLKWNWRAGTRWTGDAGASFNRALTSFANSRFFGRDLVDRKEYFGSAKYRLGPHWNLTGALQKADTSHSVDVRRTDNYHSKSGGVGIQYVNNSLDTVSFDYRFTDAVFPVLGAFNGVPYNRNYKDSSTRIVAKYAVSGKLLLDASVGYLKRDYPESVIGSFSGDIWRASLQWQLSPKTQFVFAGWRELTAYLEAESDYFVATGGSIAPTWSPTEKLSISLAASWIDQNYLRSSPSVFLFDGRKDKITSQQIVVGFAPREYLGFKASYRYEQRDSNRALLAYGDKVASLSVTLRF